MRHQAEARDTDVVTLAPDEYGDVMWFFGPVAYEDSKLSPDLIRELQAWESFFHSHRRPDHYIVDGKSMPHFRDEGTRLARRLANEIGSDFVVEFDPDERYRAVRRFRAAGDATNPTAASVFRELAVDNERDENSGWTLDLQD